MNWLAFIGWVVFLGGLWGFVEGFIRALFRDLRRWAGVR